VEEHPTQKGEIVRDRLQNAARRTLLKLHKDDISWKQNKVASITPMIPGSFILGKKESC